MKRIAGILAVALALLALTACPTPSGFELPTTSDQTAPGQPNSNYTVRVMDSIGGSALAGATVSVTESGARVASGKSKSDGTFSFYFDPAKTYTITASKDDYASSRAQGITDATKDGLALYCHKLGMVSFGAAAPTIDSVEYSTDGGTTYAPLTAGFNANQAALILRVTASSTSAIEPTAWSGFGMAACVDRMPTSYTDNYETIAAPNDYTTPAGSTTTTARWIMSGAEWPAGDHVLYIVAYDVANNRVETRYAITSDFVGTGADISSEAPSAFKVRTDVTPLSRNTFSTDPMAAGIYDGEAISYRAYITFSMLDSAQDPVPIHGYRVLRSTDGLTYRVTGTIQFGYSNNAGSFTYFDTDPDLEIGKDYWYKIVCFNDTSSTAESEAIQTTYLPPHSAALSYPANYATSSTVSPDFMFVISDPSIISGQLADTYHIQLAIKQKDGPAMYRLSLAYDIAGIYGDPGTILMTNATTGNPSAYGSEDLLSYDDGVFTFHTAAFGVALDPGVTYEWNVFGQGYATSDGPTAANFRKYNNDDPSGTYSFARSLADEPNHGYDTSNGWFTLSVAPDAE